MYWWFVFAASVIVTIVSFVIVAKTYCEWPMYTGAIAASIALVLILILIIAPITNKNEMVDYVSAKREIEKYEPSDTLQNYGLTAKIVELNMWLYKAQARKQLYGEWSFYPDEVLELTPIQKLPAPTP